MKFIITLSLCDVKSTAFVCTKDFKTFFYRLKQLVG